MTKILNGRDLADYIKQRQSQQVRGLIQAHNIVPKLAIIQAKDDPIINTYVRLKKQYGADLQVDVDVHAVSQKEVPGLIKKLNKDDSVHGIIVQLPLEDPSQTDVILNLVDPHKDVDGLGDPEAPWPPESVTKIPQASDREGRGEQQTEPYEEYGDGAAEPMTQPGAASDGGVSGAARKQAGTVRGSWFDPATPMAIMWLLAGYNVDLPGKHILLIGHGKLVGAPLAKMLKASDLDVEVIDRSIDDLQERTLNADIIVTATGSPAILFPDYIKEGAVVVDAGVASEDGKTVGDLAPEVYDRDDLTITPTKGGVGPLTVCALFDNVIRAAREGVK